MKTLYECVVRYMRTTETGLVKKVNELYLVQADDFSDAEARMIYYIKGYVTEGDIEIKSIKKSKITETLEGEGSFFKCKLVYLSIDEKTAKKKKTYIYILVQANDIKYAHSLIEKYNADNIIDSISNIDETNFMDVIL